MIRPVFVKGLPEAGLLLRRLRISRGRKICPEIPGLKRQSKRNTSLDPERRRTGIWAFRPGLGLAEADRRPEGGANRGEEARGGVRNR